MTVRLGLSSIQIGRRGQAADGLADAAPVVLAELARADPPGVDAGLAAQQALADSSRLPISRLNTSTGWLAWRAACAAMPRANDVLCTNTSAATKLCVPGTVRS